ncbi:hypothetical protein SAMN04489832_2606 [Micromonospora cremea]|uniref:Uncharacterized protein n=2 Tax=Micromonospora cremea TaxID=709881 RepID=A0A1N5WMW3_9ACTN|nr:hypothetical protein SAMN04489832_2606 [Micromonospora cremea]
MLLDAAESRFGPQIQLSQLGVDHYWNVDLRAAFGMVQRPELEIDCGQSSDDLAELASFLQRDAEGVVSLWHDIPHVSGLLRLLAYLDLPDTGEVRGNWCCDRIGDSVGSEYPRRVVDREQFVRYRQDRAVLAAIGAHLDPQIGRVGVRLPRSVAESAVAAWDREEPGGVGEESREEYDLRDDAAELALIGLAITSRGVWDGEEVVVDLDVVQIAAALRAAR